MKPLIKSLYIRLLSKPAYIVEDEALSKLFMFRCIDESTTTQLTLNFAANQKLYEEEKQILYFIVRHKVE